MSELLVVRCGHIAYDDAREAQKRLEAARHEGEISDVLLLLEHPPVYTKGRRATAEELPMGDAWYRDRGIAVTDTDRGGRVTYHGPGQLVGYPIVSLPALAGGPGGDDGTERPRFDVPGYVSRMERAIIAALSDRGVRAQVIERLTGVWTEGGAPPAGEARKIASIGIHINRGVTTHGLAINVNNDLRPFEWIVPCGIDSVQMTSLAAELGAEQDLERFAGTLAARFAEACGLRPVELPAAELAERVDGVAALAGGEARPVR